MAGYDPYGSSAASASYGMAPDLQFYSGAGAGATSGTSVHASAATGMGSMSHLGGSGGAGAATGSSDYYGAATGNMQSGPGGPGGVGGSMLSPGGFWSAFTAAPLYENEPPLLEGGASGDARWVKCPLITSPLAYMRIPQSSASTLGTSSQRRGPSSTRCGNRTRTSWTTQI